MNETIAFLDNQRDLLAPVFNQEDSTELAIRKAEQGEFRIETLRSYLVELSTVCTTAAATNTKPPTMTTSTTSTTSTTTTTKQDDMRASDPVDHQEQQPNAVNVDDNDDEAPIYAVQRLQRMALLALAEVGELLVATFPYNVPAQGKFSYLPRLLGRARVTFSFRRNNNNNNNKIGTRRRTLLGGSTTTDPVDASLPLNNNNNNNNKGFLGNITIVADGFLAPISAGNFVDLSMRNFYTGLPVKSFKKRLLQTVPTGGSASSSSTGLGGSSSSSKFSTASSSSSSSSSGGGGPSLLAIVETADVPVMGSFNEGFYDPLTAKLRRIPLELIRVENSNNVPSLSYSLQGTSLGGLAFLDLSSKLDDTTNTVVDLQPLQTQQPPQQPQQQSSTARGISYSSSKPLVSFGDIQGLVALNHPDKYPNSGSSEFFALQTNSM